MEEQKRAVIYCRVSTKEQVEEGNSLATQEKICRDYAIKHNYALVQSFIELGESAKTADRTELKKLLAFCTTKKEKIDAVIIYRVDRLSRQVEDYAFIKSKLRQCGVTIKSTAEHFEDDPAGRFMENIIANVAQFDNDVRTERSINGMRDAVREGRYVWRAPLGYSNTKLNGKSNIAPNKQAPIIQRAFMEIAKNRLPVDVVHRNINKKWGKNGMQVITRSHFHTLMKNELYAGWITKFGERHQGSFEPLVSDELFNEVQYIVGTRKRPKNGYKTDHQDFPLRKFFSHPLGNALTGGWSKGKNKKYAYYFYHLPKHMYRKETVDNAFFELLNSYTLDEPLFGKLIAFAKKHLLKDVQDEKLNAVNYKTRMSLLREKQQALIEKNLKGILSDGLLKRQLDGIDTELRELQHLLFPNNQKVPSEQIIPLLREFVEHPAEIWKKAYFKGQLQLQWFYFPKGVIWDGLNCRTPEISCLLRLKELLSNEKSVNVHQGFSGLNTSEIAESPIHDESMLVNKEFLDSIQNELLKLQEIVSATNE